MPKLSKSTPKMNNLEKTPKNHRELLQAAIDTVHSGSEDKSANMNWFVCLGLLSGFATSHLVALL